MKQLDESDFELIGTEYESLFPKDKPYLRCHHFKDSGSADNMYQIMNDELFPFIKNLKVMENLLMLSSRFLHQIYYRK